LEKKKKSKRILKSPESIFPNLEDRSMKGWKSKKGWERLGERLKRPQETRILRRKKNVE